MQIFLKGLNNLCDGIKTGWTLITWLFTQITTAQDLPPNAQDGSIRILDIWASFFGKWRHVCHFSCLQTSPLGKIRRIGYGVYPEFAFHICTTQREVFCTDVFTTASNPLQCSGERCSSRVQQAEAGGDVLTLLRSSHGFVYSTLTPSLITTNSLDSLICVFTQMNMEELRSLKAAQWFYANKAIEAFSPSLIILRAFYAFHSLITCHWLRKK